MKKLSFFLLLLFSVSAYAQRPTKLNKKRWVDSVFKSLNSDQRLGQLMVVRLSARTADGVVWYDSLVTENIKKYNIGSICLFQGNPSKQAEMINGFQKIAKTPIMVCIDAEWGLGMRLDSVANFPFQLTLGAMQDKQLVYQVGKAI